MPILTALSFVATLYAASPADLPGRQCAAFILTSAPLYDRDTQPWPPTGRVASADRAPTERDPTARDAEPRREQPARTDTTQRPTGRVPSERGAVVTAPTMVGLAPVLDPGSLSSLPDGWVPIGGGPAVVPTGRVGDTQYYDVRNYVIACEALETVTPLPR